MSDVYDVQIVGTAKRQLKRLSPEIRQRIKIKIDELATDPRPHGYTKLKTRDIRFRVRTGDYRIIYKIFDDVLLVLVLEIGHRREVYRDL